MKSLPRIGPRISALLLLAGFLLPSPGSAQSGPPASAGSQPSKAAAIVQAVRVVPDKDGAAVEILSNGPLVPTLLKLEGPSRLVIDLPNANTPLRKKRIDFRNEQVSGVRVDQFQNDPPVARVVVDLVKPVGYTWDAAGNRLTVRLRPHEGTVQPPTVPTLTHGAQPVAVPIAPGTSGTVMLAGSRVTTGSAVTAGADSAVLSLGRGGEVRVCPGTTVSVASSQNGRDMMLGMSTGALEAHYTLSASADSVLTPDFRILLAGPGEFHYAISADSRGNTCVRALAGNTASVIVSELMGDGTYQVKPNEQIVFRSGRLKMVDSAVPGNCGCAAPPIPVMRASAAPPVVIPEQKLGGAVRLAQPGDEVAPVRSAASNPVPAPSSTPPSHLTLSIGGPETAPLPASQPNEVHIQVDAPFVFRASPPPAPPVPPAPTVEAQLLPISDSPRPTPLEAAVLPPAEAKPEHRGFFGKLRGFFAAIFG